MTTPYKTSYSDNTNWVTFTPTVLGLTLGTGGTASGTYCQIGKTIHLFVEIILGTGFIFPANGNNRIQGIPPMEQIRMASGIQGTVTDGTNYYQLKALGIDNTTIRILHPHVSLAEVPLTNLLATDPVTFAVGHIFTLSGTYKTI